MATLLRSRVTLVWGLLLLATLASWELGHGFGFRSAVAASIGILLVSLVKVYLVMAEFMELRHAPAAALWVMRGWLVALGGAMILLYLR